MAAQSSNLGGLAERYSAALFELADERRELERVANDLTQLRQAIAQSADLRRLLASPLLDRDEQSRAMAALAERMGLGETVRKFVGLVARNRRLFVLDAMIGAFLAELARHRGEVKAEVISAQPLKEAQRAAVVEALRRVVGAKIAVDTGVDESLIGGLVVRVGSRQIDTSLKSKLMRLQLAMKGA